MSSQTLAKVIEVLLVEDNPGDVRLMQEALKEYKMANKLHVVENGMEAMAFLRREGRFADIPRPDLILLDLNLPRKDGRQVLAEIKQDPNLKRIPVVVLTTSKNEEDIIRSYDNHANCFITKPVDLNQFTKIVKWVQDFWFAIVTLPSEQDR